jgi:hypothetical protein
MSMIKVTTPKCMFCKKTTELEVDEFKLKLFIRGESVQSMWPEWNADQRELLLTGTHPECWDAMLPPEDED